MIIRERKHRLNSDLYRGIVKVTFTICTKDKKELFINDELVTVFKENLKKSNHKYNIMNWCYVFMPEHVHIVNEGREVNSDLLKAINLLKQYSGYYLSKNAMKVELQKDYYDHIHRRDEDLVKHIRYIVDNPVRRGLVERWQDYKYTGSIDHDLYSLIG